jgi:hypothetical protein
MNGKREESSNLAPMMRQSGTHLLHTEKYQIQNLILRNSLKNADGTSFKICREGL